MTLTLEVVPFIATKVSVSFSFLKKENGWMHHISWMSTVSLKSTTLLALHCGPGHHACSCVNYKHVIKVSGLIWRVSFQLMRSCHMVFIELTWTCCEPSCLHHHFLQLQLQELYGYAYTSIHKLQ